MAIIIKHNDITLFASQDALFHFAANDFKTRARVAVNKKGKFTVVLSGGSTPKVFFDTLASSIYAKEIPWCDIQFFFGDERYVPADDPQSNYHMANEHLFSKVSVKPENIFRMPTEYADPLEAAKQYKKIIQQALNADQQAPHFDLVYLGLGDDAHTASLMPQSAIVEKFTQDANAHQDEWVASYFVPKLNMVRMTLTPAIINHAENVIFLVTGLSKAQAVYEVIEGKVNPSAFPAQLIQCQQQNNIWYMDELAAGALLNAK